MSDPGRLTRTQSMYSGLSLSPRSWKSGTEPAADWDEKAAAFFLPRRERLFGSTLKRKHESGLRSTFTNFRCLRGIGPESCRHIRSPEPEEEEERFCEVGSPKSYAEIRAALAREISDMQKSRQLEHHAGERRRYHVRGIYQVHTPTEGELFFKSQLMRRSVNPVAFSREQRVEKEDRRLMEKRRARKDAKNRGGWHRLSAAA